MPTYLAPGVYMEEVDKGPKPIEAVATAVAGFVGLAARGPLNRPISVNSWSDYVRVFGGLADDSLMSHSVFGYFNNGGQNAYAVRVANQATMRRARYILSYRPVGRQAAYSARGLTAGATSAVLSDASALAVGDTLTLTEAAVTANLVLTAVNAPTGMVTWATALVHDYSTAATMTKGALHLHFRSLTAGATSAVFPMADGLPVGTRLEFHEDLPAGPSRETVTVTAVDQATGTVTWAPGLAHTFFQPAITVAPGAAYPTEYALKSAVAPGAGLIELSDSRGLATGDRIALWENADAPEIQQIVAIGADGKITLSSTLANGYSTEAVVAAHPGIMLTAAPDPATVTGGSDAAQSNGMGTWGNDIRVRIDDTALVRTTLTTAISTPVTEAVLKSTKGIAADSVVRFYDRVSERAEYRVVTAVFSGNRIAWAAAQPLTGTYATDKTEVSTAEFRLTIRHRWSGVTEAFDGLSMQPGYTDRYAVTVVNETRGEAKASGLVQIESLVDAAWTDVTPEHRLPLAMKKGEWHNLRGGRNGSVDITVSDFKGQNLGPDNRSGLACFEGVDQVTIVILADAVGKNEKGDLLFAAANVQALHEAMLEHAESMGDRFAIVDCRAGLDLQAVQEQRGELSSKYGAFYYPWIYVD
ncbi:MAG: Phage tail sheath protein, partial [Firmicutes bacterium]|nr:Phage tail sheath protein [Bacillota bacterium]